MDRLLTFKELRPLIGNRTQRSLYTDIAKDRFPEPVKIGRSVYFRESDISAFIAVGCDMTKFEAAKANGGTP